MPNWCWNNLHIAGDKKELNKFKKLMNKKPKKHSITNKSKFDSLKKEYLLSKKKDGWARDNLTSYLDLSEMNSKDFMVKVLNFHIDTKGNAYKKEEDGLLNKFYTMPEKLENTTADYGRSGLDWYSWRVQNWGTKWDVNINDNGYESSLEWDDDFINVSFDSAWSPPTNWLIKVSKDYPNLHFTLEYEESGCAFKGVMEICRNNDIFSDDTWDWYGDCGECETDYTTEGHCKCEDDNGNKLIWGEEVDTEEEDSPCAV